MTVVEVQSAQKNLEANQEDALLQLQKQVLKELDAKMQGVDMRQSPKHPINGSDEDEIEWFRRVPQSPKTQSGRGRDEPFPQRYK